MSTTIVHKLFEFVTTDFFTSHVNNYVEMGNFRTGPSHFGALGKTCICHPLPTPVARILGCMRVDFSFFGPFLFLCCIFGTPERLAPYVNIHANVHFILPSGPGLFLASLSPIGSSKLKFYLTLTFE